MHATMRRNRKVLLLRYVRVECQVYIWNVIVSVS